MAKSNSKIHDLQSLEVEIRRLRLDAKRLEHKLDDNLDYLQEHSSSLMINSLLSGLIKKESISGAIAGFFLQNERLQKNIGRLAEILIDKAAGGMDVMIDKLSAKKE
jgi:hypothetical protein